MTYRAWLCCVLLVVVGCGGHGTGTPEDAAKPADSSGSDGVMADGGVDAPTDSMIDASIDSMIDAPVDAMIDAPIDAMIDASPDAMVDAAIDAPPDAMVDAAIDAPMIDAPIDAPNCTVGVTPAFCPGGCTDLAIDPLNCGMCGTTCASNQLCMAGGCVPNCMLTPTAPDLCNGSCTNKQDDESNCGSCGNQCGSGQICSAGTCVPDCQAPTPNLCNNTTCVDFQTDEAHCGNCTTTCTGGKDCIGGTCQCTGATPNLCGTTCTNTMTDNANCGMCGMGCGPGLVCTGGQCLLNCQNPTPDLCNGSCTNKLADDQNCGACGTVCKIGGFCDNGACACPVSAPTVCNGACVSLQQDAQNCGMCGHACAAGESCNAGLCCGTGQTGCPAAGGNPATCSNLDNDPNNCGSCGHACMAGEQCLAGQCGCPYGQSYCNGACIPTAVDANNCGGCGNVCPAGQACVSNGCSTTCPAPLVKCGNQCVDLKSDNAHCGSCSNAACTGNNGCSNGACVPTVPVNPPPAKCANGGPPIVVPTGGTNTCAGNIGSTAFTYALCSRTDIGPLSRTVTTDAFDSTLGPYVPGQKGGSIGVNGTVNDTAKLTIGGDLRIGSAALGMDMKGDVTIRQRFYDLGGVGLSKLLSVQEDAYIAGTVAASGGGLGTITGKLTTPNCGSVPGQLSYGSCAAGPVTFSPPCGTALDQIPVRQIVQYFEDPAHNDNAALGLSKTALANPSNPVRLDLPCGYYHLTSIGGSQPITIVAHGHTALFVSGAINTTKPFTVNLDPTATFDIFVGGVMVSSQEISIGNPAYPRLTRVYVGSASCKGNGSCTASSDCCSGVCNAGSCTGGGGGLTNSLKLSSGSTFLNGLFYAGYGDIRFSNPLEMYGALYANYFDASGETLIHYDNGAVQNGNECPQPTSCESCFDCNNQACKGGQCGACTADSDCCQPLRCMGGTCKL